VKHLALRRRYGRARRAFKMHAYGLEPATTLVEALEKAQRLSSFGKEKLYVFQVHGRPDVADGTWMAYLRPPMKHERIGSYKIVTP
jgi:hypothetical protein